MRAAPAVLAAALAMPALGQAPQASLDSGLWLGARVGYGVSSGEVSQGGLAVRDVVDREVPFWLDLGYRFNRWMWGEAFLELAPAKVAEESCPREVACSASHVRFGLAGQLHLWSRGPVDPWIAVGIGVEVLNAERWDASLPGVTEWTWAGIEFPAAEAGIDFAVSRRFSLGPYATLSIASFTSASRRPSGGPTVRSSVEDRASHSWAQVGLRAVLKL